MFIFVDPTGEKLKMELWDQEKILSKSEWPLDHQLSQKFLDYLDEFLSTNTITKENLKGLVVVRGPGSFTTLRVVISTLNVLAYALDIPILGIEKGEKFSEKVVEKLIKANNFKDPVAPYYKESPKITRSKKV
ncbi:hypothetical protein ACFL24_01615 [Patescibacteria group bacterium]